LEAVAMAGRDDSDIELEIEGEHTEAGEKTLLEDIRKIRGSDQISKPLLFDKDEIDLIFKDWDVQLPYSCKLTLDDISLSDVKGETKTYQIQVLKNKEGIYGVFCKWSGAGGKCDYSINKNENLDEVVHLFKQKFYEKTFNSWDQREVFKVKPGAYRFLGNYRETQPTKMDVEVDGEKRKIKEKLKLIMLRAKTQSSTLNRSIFSIILHLFDLDETECLLDEYSINKTRLSLETLEIRDLLRCHKILADLECQIFSTSRKNQKIFELSGDFNCLIPLNHKVAQNQMIDDIAKLRRAYYLVTVLLGMCYQVQLIKTIEFDELSKTQPLDQVYASLGCQLRPLPHSGNPTSESIHKMLTSIGTNHQGMKLIVRDIMEVHREKEMEAFFPFKQLKRKMLWIGAPMPRIVEYLYRGTAMIKTESAASAGFFGKAIYCTDVVSKAAKHCGIDQSGKVGYLLLCDVAVGNEYVTERSKIYPKPPKGYHSIKGQGKFESEGFTTIDGASGSIGVPVKISGSQESTFLYNEFAVFDEAQVKICYLVRVEFNY
jgi:poly [ADP-ribose] polymerase